MQGAARVMSTLATMSVEEADKLGIDLKIRRSIVRLDNAKLNLAPAPGEAQWMRLVGVPLGNGTDEYPDGDNVQVMTPWKLPSAFEGLSWTDIRIVLGRVQAGPGDGEQYTFSRQGGRWVGLAFGAADGNGAPASRSDGQITAILAAWKSNGLLVEGLYHSPKQRRDIACVRVDDVKAAEIDRQFRETDAI